MATSLQFYLNVLGVSEQADLNEIKKAYRERAKLFHPDLNKEPNAHDKFILINEAYAFLVNHKTDSRQKHIRQNKQEKAESEVKAARARAAAHARMRYEAFTQTEYYQSTHSLADTLDVFITLATIVVFALITIFAYAQNGTAGLAGALVVDVLGLSFLYMITLRRNDLSFRRYFNAFSYLIRWRYFHLAILVIIHLLVFFKIGFNTIMPTILLALSYFVFPAAAYFALQYLSKTKSAWIAFVLTPAIFTLFLLTNYFFSDTPVHEQYYYTLLTDDTGKESTLIELEGGNYESCIGVRLFMNFSDVQQHNTIHYETAVGLFGIRVVKSYRFSRQSFLPY